MHRTVLMLGLAAGLAFACPALAQSSGPFTIDALLRQESLGDARVSPDGRWIALERRARYDRAPSYKLSRDPDEAGGRLLPSVPRRPKHRGRDPRAARIDRRPQGFLEPARRAEVAHGRPAQ